MTTILQMNQEDLRNEVKNCFREYFEEIRNLPEPKPLPDRMNFKEACEFTGLSDSKMYKLSMLNEIPVSRFCGRLSYSRKEVTAWKEDRTIAKNPSRDLVSESLAKSAKKQLKKY